MLPFLAWPRPDAALLRGEALAGLTVGLMVIPQGVAYAALAGMPLVTGIYASLLPALIAVLFSASPRLSVGPTALTCLLVGASLTGLAEPGSQRWIELAVWLALLTGLLQIVLGFARFGWLLNLVNSPVLMAFTQAAAVLIIASQLPALLGLGGWDSLTWPAQVHLPSLAFGLGGLAALMLARRWRPGFPTVLAVVVASAGISYFTGFEAGGGAVVGALPQGLPMPYLPGWPGWSVLGQLVLPTLVITLVSFLETASSAKVDNGQRGQRWDQDQDLIGQGLAKLASALSGAFPTSSSFSRSALNLYAGAKTGWATVFSVAVVLLALLFFTPLLHPVPLAVLAANAHLAPGYAITDPNKLIVLTPGFDRETGGYANHGIPAPVVAQYLRENQVVPEKNDLNSLLFLLTPGVESSKAGTLLSALVAFKKLHDDNARLDDVIGEFVRRRPARYAGLRLRDLCAEMHAFFRDSAVSTLQRAQFAPEHLPEPVLAPHEAVQRLVRNDVDYVLIGEAQGRIATTMFVVYPPGIASIAPGERLGKRARPMLDYLKMFERCANLFPGFDVEIQGIYRETGKDGTIRFYTYVVRE